MSDVLYPESESNQVYVSRLKALALSDDSEQAHIKADEVLTDMLIRLGYDEVVQAYRAIRRWYS